MLIRDMFAVANLLVYFNICFSINQSINQSIDRSIDQLAINQFNSNLAA